MPINRNIHLLLTLISITLGWLFHAISCACEKEQFVILLGKDLINQNVSCCGIFYNSYHCICFPSSEKYGDVNTLIMTGCSCRLKSKSLYDLKMAVSEISEKRIFKQLLNNNACTLYLSKNTNPFPLKTPGKYFSKIDDPISLNLFYCQLNI